MATKKYDDLSKDELVKLLQARDRRDATVYAAGRTGPTLLALAVGVVAWAVFAFWAHGWLIGVRPFG